MISECHHSRRKEISSRGTDLTEAMYGGLEVAEAICTGTIDALMDSTHSPHVLQRGIKFNLPLDLRTPSYSDMCSPFSTIVPAWWTSLARRATWKRTC